MAAVKTTSYLHFPLDRQSSKHPLKISIYSFNCAGLIFNERASMAEQLEYEESRYQRYYLTRYITNPSVSGEIADFVKIITDEVSKSGPDVVFFAFQESPKPGDKLNSDCIPFEMDKVGYVLLKRSRFMGLGKTTYDSMITTGVPRYRGLRNSLYVRKGMEEAIITEEKIYSSVIGDCFQKSFNCGSVVERSKGGLVSYLKIPSYDLIAFINCHLPYESSSLVAYKKTGNPFARTKDLLDTSSSLNKIIWDFVYNHENDAFRPNIVFLAGDLNYRVTVPNPLTFNIVNEWPQYISKKTMEHDELANEMRKSNIFPFREGTILPDGGYSGPSFMFTGKLKKGRIAGDVSLSAYNVGKHHQRLPSWCDRILYNTLLNGPGGDKLRCVGYDRFDHGSMTKSDHCGVKSFFLLDPNY